MNDFVPLVPVDELPADLRADYDATDRPGLRDFIRMMANAPDHFRRYNEVYGHVRYDNHLGPRLTELVRLTVAQTTLCQLCLSSSHHLCLIFQQCSRASCNSCRQCLACLLRYP